MRSAPPSMLFEENIFLKEAVEGVYLRRRFLLSPHAKKTPIYAHRRIGYVFARYTFPNSVPFVMNIRLHLIAVSAYETRDM